MVRMKGLEPSRPKAHAPKACVSTNSTTSAHVRLVHACLRAFTFHAATTFASLITITKKVTPGKLTRWRLCYYRDNKRGKG